MPTTAGISGTIALAQPEMPTIRQFRGLERGAPADLWRRTLAQIPALFGRLVYLNSLRSSDTGQYEHHGLAQVYGEAEASRALLESHEETFGCWLGLTLEQQKADLDLYLSALNSPRSAIVENWLRSCPYRNLVPFSARKSERELFGCDFEALLDLLRREYQLERPDPED